MNILSMVVVKTNPKKMDAVSYALSSTDRTRVRGFLRLAGGCSYFIRNFKGIFSPFHAATSTKFTSARSKDYKVAFDTLKTALTMQRVLEFPYFESSLIMETVASATAVGAVLYQKKEGQIHPIMYARRTLNVAERN